MKRTLLSFNIVRWNSKHNSKELERHLEKFGEKLTEFKENEILKKMKNSYKEAYNTILEQNSELAKDMKHKADSAIRITEDALAKVGHTIKPLKKPLEEISKKMEPHVQNIKESEAAKTISSLAADIDKELKETPSYYQYGGVSSKERRSLYEKEISQKYFPANEKAGSSVVPSESSSADKIGSIFRIGLPWKVQLKLPKSNNIFAHLLREGMGNFADKIKFLFEESDLAKAIRSAKALNPTFSMESLIAYSRDYIVPEFTEAIINHDMNKLDKLGSESVVNTVRASYQEYAKKGLSPKGAVLDIRDVEIVSGKVIDNIPLFVITCTVHQISYVTDAGGLVVQGKSDQADFVNYVFAVTIRDSLYRVIEFTSRERTI